MLTCGSSAQSGIIVLEAEPRDVQPHSAIQFVDDRGYGAAEELLTVTWHTVPVRTSRAPESAHSALAVAVRCGT